MSVPGVGYDEVGSRTRQAWLRTSLNIIGVTLLAERGLMLANAPMWALLLALVPAIGFLVVAVLRSGELRHADSVQATSVVAVSIFSAVVGVLIIGVISILV